MRVLQGPSVLDPRHESRLAVLGLPSARVWLAGRAGATDVTGRPCPLCPPSRRAISPSLALSSAGTWPASSAALSVSTQATISPVPASTARCSLRRDRRARPCFSASHSLRPNSFKPVLFQPGIMVLPVPDPVAGLRNVAAGGVVLERHARERNGSAAAGLLAPAPSHSLHQRPSPPKTNNWSWPPDPRFPDTPLPTSHPLGPLMVWSWG